MKKSILAIAAASALASTAWAFDYSQGASAVTGASVTGGISFSTNGGAQSVTYSDSVVSTNAQTNSGATGDEPYANTTGYSETGGHATSFNYTTGVGGYGSGLATYSGASQANSNDHEGSTSEGAIAGNTVGTSAAGTAVSTTGHWSYTITGADVTATGSATADDDRETAAPYYDQSYANAGSNVVGHAGGHNTSGVTVLNDGTFSGSQTTTGLAGTYGVGSAGFGGAAGAGAVDGSTVIRSYSASFNELK